MKRVTVADAAGKPLKVALLTDWDLLYCIPYAVLAFLYRATLVVVNLLVGAVTAPLSVLFRKANLSLGWAIVLFPCFIAAASAVTAAAGSFSIPDLVSALVLFLYGATISSKVISHYFHLEDARFPAAGKLSRREAATVARMREEAARLPDSCVRNAFDKSILYIGCLRTLLMLPALICAVLLPPSWLNYALIAYIVLHVFNNFEAIEHVGSHSVNGQLLISQHAPWWTRAVEFLRRYVVWPLFGWFPDMYFVTHALHHHVENNGPADWQSTIRYDRTSILDFAKSVTWFGINVAVPIDTVYYLAQKRRFRLLGRLLRGLAFGFALLAGLAIVEPVLFVALAANVLFAGFAMYRFAGIWHGFHDPSHAYHVEAANQSLIHYAHHAQRRVHLRDLEGLARVVREIERPSPVFTLRPEFESRLPFWQLQGLLWKKDFALAAECLVEHNTVTQADMAWVPFTLRRDLVGRGVGAAVMQRLTASFFPSARSPWLQRLDAVLSKSAGAIASRFGPITPAAVALASGRDS